MELAKITIDPTLLTYVAQALGRVRAVQAAKKEKSFTGIAEIASFFSLAIFPITLKSPSASSIRSGRASLKGSTTFWYTGPSVHSS